MKLMINVAEAVGGNRGPGGRTGRVPDGNSWPAITATPQNRFGIEALHVGDRV